MNCEGRLEQSFEIVKEGVVGVKVKNSLFKRYKNRWVRFSRDLSFHNCCRFELFESAVRCLTDTPCEVIVAYPGDRAVVVKKNGRVGVQVCMHHKVLKIITLSLSDADLWAQLINDSLNNKFIKERISHLRSSTISSLPSPSPIFSSTRPLHLVRQPSHRPPSFSSIFPNDFPSQPSFSHLPLPPPSYLLSQSSIPFQPPMLPQISSERNNLRSTNLNKNLSIFTYNVQVVSLPNTNHLTSFNTPQRSISYKSSPRNKRFSIKKYLQNSKRFSVKTTTPSYLLCLLQMTIFDVSLISNKESMNIMLRWPLDSISKHGANDTYFILESDCSEDRLVIISPEAKDIDDTFKLLSNQLMMKKKNGKNF